MKLSGKILLYTQRTGGLIPRIRAFKPPTKEKIIYKLDQFKTRLPAYQDMLDVFKDYDVPIENIYLNEKARSQISNEQTISALKENLKNLRLPVDENINRVLGLKNIITGISLEEKAILFWRNCDEARTKNLLDFCLLNKQNFIKPEKAKREEAKLKENKDLKYFNRSLLFLVREPKYIGKPVANILNETSIEQILFTKELNIPTANDARAKWIINLRELLNRYIKIYNDFIPPKEEERIKEIYTAAIERLQETKAQQDAIIGRYRKTEETPPDPDQTFSSILVFLKTSCKDPEKLRSTPAKQLFHNLSIKDLVEFYNKLRATPAGSQQLQEAAITPGILNNMLTLLPEKIREYAAQG